MTTARANTASLSWYEASARQRIDALLDRESFREFIGPEQRVTSPHLSIFDLPEQFDDGIVARDDDDFQPALRRLGSRNS